jgi:beta-mannosidase
MRNRLPIVGLCLSMVPASAQVSTRSLNDGWQFTEAGKEQWSPAEVPGVVHTDLLRNGRIPDPFRDLNVDSVQWVEDRDWIYQRTLWIRQSDLENERIDLVFKGLDTFTEIVVNDSVIGRTDNMFRVWTFPIKAMLRVGENRLVVNFRSPVKEGTKTRERYGIQLPHDSDPSGIAPYVRKAAYQFGWDFAPRMVTCGIWQPVELRLSGPVGRMTSTVTTTWRGEDLSVVVHPFFEQLPNRRSDQELVASVHLDGELMANAAVPKGSGSLPVLQFDLSSPERWWPNGEGGQRVHQLRVELRSGDALLSTYERPLGFREVELDRTADKEGEPFRFLVNGRPVFMRGCNLVPPDMFLPRGGDSVWVALVKDMADAHMNMVRVWSGGVYPPDAFFTACDTAGILVWQDLMFGYMAPGGDSAFIRTVTAEIKEQVKRIAVHPSLALFCGNNELDVAWNNWGWQQRYGLHGADSALVWQDHHHLFSVLLPQLTAPWTYTTTSPLSNWGNAEGLRRGDLHYWGVWHGDSTFASFKGNVGRFVSEYGFQSYPDSSTLARFIEPEQLYLGSPALAFRQRSYRTDAPILQAIERELGERPITLGGFIEASQEVQALAYELAIRAHWEDRPRCMGTLLWQLNEPWPGPSWSIVDHAGVRKPSYFRVRDLYKQMLGPVPLHR